MTKKPDPQDPDRFITFHASLPDIMSAITLPGHADAAARIKLDVPASDMIEVLKLKAAGSGNLLKITVEILPKKVDHAADAMQRRLAAAQMDEDDATLEND